MGDVQAHIPQSLQATVMSAVEHAVEQRVAQRLRAADGTLWGAPDTTEVQDRLGWIDVAGRTLGQIDELQSFADELREEGVEHVVLLGMGGSSLAPEVLRRSLRATARRPRLHVLDSTDAGAVRALQESIDVQRTLFVVSSKSGATIEPLSLLAHFWSLVEERAGGRPTAAAQGEATHRPADATTAAQGEATHRPADATTAAQGEATHGPADATTAAQGEATHGPADATTAAQGEATHRPADATTAAQGEATSGPADGTAAGQAGGADTETGRRFAAITDPGTGLERLAREHGFRRVFHGDPRIGGRYSALSPFGVVPAVLAGLQARALLERASSAWDARVHLDVDDVEPMRGLPAAVWIGATLAALARAGRDKLTLVVQPPLDALGLWEEQLFAESTGKRGAGILPVAGETLGESEVYGDDRVFVYVSDASAPAIDEHLRARVLALADAGHPVLEIPLTGPLDLGRAFMLSELSVAVAGWALGVNPFDQPDVQRSKDATSRVLERFEREGSLPSETCAGRDELRALLHGAAPPDYVAIMAYVKPSDELDDAATQLRAVIRDATKSTTTFGYGPRFLHSTGQFHKGGPRTGRFLQLIHDDPHDVQIPDRPYTFNTLKNAQSIGDLQTLRELGLPAERVRLQGDDPAAALRTLTEKIKETL